MREKLIEKLDQVEAWAEGFGDKLEIVEKYLPKKKEDCTSSISCECQRYKCPGRVAAVSTFWREMKSL